MEEVSTIHPAENQIIDERKEKIKSWLKDNNLLFISGILIFSFFIRFYFFQIAKNQTHWWDSLAYGDLAKNIIFHRWDSSIFVLGEQVIRPPLLPYAWSFLLRLNFSDAASIFVMELIPSVVSVWLIFLIVKKMYGEKVAYISAFILSVSWIHLFYTMRMLTDIPSFAFSLASVYFFIKSYEKVELKSFAISVFFLSLAVLTRYAYAAVSVVYVLFLLICHKHKLFFNKKFFLGGIIGAIPLLAFFAVNLFTYGSIMPATSVYEAGAESQPFAFFVLRLWDNNRLEDLFLHPLDAQMNSLLPHILKPIWLFFLIIGFFIVFFSTVLSYGYISKTPKLRMNIFNLLFLLVSLGFFIFIVRAAEDRYLIMILLPMISLISLGIVYVADMIDRKSVKAGAIIIILVLVLGAYAQLSFAKGMIESKKYSFSQMKDAFLWIKENTPENSVILGTGAEPYAIYYSERPVEAWPQKDFENVIAETIEKSDYLVINAFHPTDEKILQYINKELQGKLETVYVSFFDAEQKQPAVVIYKINKVSPATL